MRPAQDAPAPPPLTDARIRRRLLALARPILPPLGLSILFRTIGLAAGIALLGLAGWAVLGTAGGGRGAGGGGGGGQPAFAAAEAASNAARPLGHIIAALVVLSLVKGLARYLEQYCGHYVAFRALAQLRLFFYDRLAPQAPAALEGRDTGDLLSRVTKDVDRVEVFFAHTIAPAVTAGLVPAATLVYVGAAVTPWAVAPLAAGLLVVGLVTPAIGSAGGARAAYQIRQARGQIAAHVRDSVQGVREVLAFDYQERRLDQLDRLGAPLGRGLRSLGDTIALRRGVNVAVMALTLIAQLIVLTASAVDPAALGLGLGITVAAFAPVTAVEDFAADLQQAYASARRVFEVTDAVPLVPDPAASRAGQAAGRQPSGAAGGAGAGGAASGGEEGANAGAERGAGAGGAASGGQEGANAGAAWAPEVRFEAVTFRYPGGRRLTPALAEVDLVAPAGQTTAVVGASGSGKSTLAALLTRSWDPTAGQIKLDGRPLDAWSLAELRQLVAVASQRPYLFNQSIRENLLLARPNATAAELGRAVRAAHLEAVAETKAGGLDAPVGEMGELLSGGERQRLALARTLLRAPAVLVLDEATSQLDPAAEAAVLDGIKRAGAGRTVLVIAHRLSTVREADIIYVLDAGRVVQQGGFDELARRPGPFADLLAREDQAGQPDLAA
ncbi:MAG: ABC transporter ATP-binding protein/permease [Bifidobacteriaceae bacterium]|jgi:ABC-type multidrug transport system fused ATPase/permease subunit|nr:ABC transporter ATP-binding protein/permease [Bifidobacteriaceae bacterium]